MCVGSENLEPGLHSVRMGSWLGWVCLGGEWYKSSVCGDAWSWGSGVVVVRAGIHCLNLGRGALEFLIRKMTKVKTDFRIRTGLEGLMAALALGHGSHVRLRVEVILEHPTHPTLSFFLPSSPPSPLSPS